MALFGVMAAATAAILLTVSRNQTQMYLALVVVLGAAFWMTNLGQKRAAALGIRSSAELPPIPVPRRIAAAAPGSARRPGRHPQLLQRVVGRCRDRALPQR